MEPTGDFWGGVGAGVADSPGWMVVGALLVVSVAFIIAKYIVPSHERVRMKRIEIEQRQAETDAERVKAIEATCNVGDFSTREAEVVREALSKKFGLQFKKLSEREARRINLLKTYNSDDGGSWNYPGSFSINPYAFHYSNTTIWSAKKAGCRIIVADDPRFGRVGIAAFYENPERLQRLEEDAKEAEWENIGTDLDAL